MLFSSSIFIAVFLPITFFGFQLFRRFGRTAEFGWLTAASLFFYGYWDPRYLALLLGSAAMNFVMSRLIAAGQGGPAARRWLIVAIALNIGLLVWFKYLFAVLSFLHGFGGPSPDWASVVLPLGISFFTFTQMAYLIDLSQEAADPEGPLAYLLFVTFFPHLIAGPILHHSEMMPQFRARRSSRFAADDVALGLTWFVLGLSKKVLIADRVGPLADALYTRPQDVGLVGTWIGVLSYSVQLYFDFSGYSDMALGLAKMFSIDFPVNFNSPYQSRTIIEFWSRWHMTLTRYITAYLYNPISLSLNRWRLARGKKVSKSATRTLGGFSQLVGMPTMLAMFLAGIWHGAGLQYIVFGLLHGSYLTINHAWRTFTPDRPNLRRLVPGWSGYVLTAMAVLLGQIFFRAPSCGHAAIVIAGLLHLHGGSALASTQAGQLLPPMSKMIVSPLRAVPVLGAVLAIAWFLPNTQQILGQAAHDSRRNPPVERWLRWRPSVVWLIVAVGLLALCMALLDASTSFLYFQF